MGIQNTSSHFCKGGTLSVLVYLCLMKIQLPRVTLIGIDCVDAVRLQEAMNICERSITFAHSKLLTSHALDDPRVIPIPLINTIEEYSRFCIEDLVHYVDTDYVLIVQYDGFILNPNSWSDDFLEYDYVGAPWKVADWSVRDFDFPSTLLGTRVVGNGGFCLRSKQFLKTSSRLKKCGSIARVHPEDVALCVWYKDLFVKEGIRFAPPTVASRFSFEGMGTAYDRQFGFHGYAWTNIDLWMKEHPEYPIAQEWYRKKSAQKKQHM